MPLRRSVTDCAPRPYSHAPRLPEKVTALARRRDFALVPITTESFRKKNRVGMADAATQKLAEQRIKL